MLIAVKSFIGSCSDLYDCGTRRLSERRERPALVQRAFLYFFTKLVAHGIPYRFAANDSNF